MGKPTHYIFAGVGEKGFSEEDEAKLPDVIRREYQFKDLPSREELKVDGVEFERFHFGQKQNDDPGDFAGFGVLVNGEWYDSGCHGCVDIKDIYENAMKTLEKVKAIFKEWGLDAEPKIMNFCWYGP